MLSITPKEGPHGAPRYIEVQPAADVTAAISKFKADRGIHHILAFSGGADDDNPLAQHIAASIPKLDLPDDVKAPFSALVKDAPSSYVASIIRDILKPLRGCRIAVQTGGTKWGVPRVAIEVARECGFPTIGVYPRLAEGKHALPKESLDLAICVHQSAFQSNWGDETSVFIKLLDSVVVIGGGSGTLFEMAGILKLNERKGIPVKHIVPISGTGGTADRMQSFPGKLETMAACLPHQRITTGLAARRYLVERVLNDIYEPEEAT